MKEDYDKNLLNPVLNNDLLQSDSGYKRQNQKQPKNMCRLVVSVILISLSSFYFGFSLTYLQAISIHQLKHHYGQIIDQPTTMPILTGSIPLGALFGSLFAEVLARFFTRKKYLFNINIVALLINIIIQYTNILVLLVCRALTGVLVGLYLGIVPIYIHQITPKSVSGVLGSFTHSQHLLGNIVSYLLGTIFYITKSEGQFAMRFQMSFTTIPILLQMIFIVNGYIPQSPNSLLQNSQLGQARQVLLIFNQQSQIDQIINVKLAQNHSRLTKAQKKQVLAQKNNQIQNNIVNDNQSDQIDMNWKSYLLGFQLPFTQQMTGNNFLVTQLTTITVVYHEVLSHYAALIANIVQIIGTFLSALVIHKSGRRSIILFGSLALAIIDILIAASFYALDKLGWVHGFSVCMILIVIFNLIFGLTLGPIVWLYIPQIVTQNVVPIATATYWLGCSLCVIVAPIITAQINSAFGVFLFFGIYLIVTFIINRFLVVETKGLTAIQVSHKFKEL